MSDDSEVKILPIHWVVKWSILYGYENFRSRLKEGVCFKKESIFAVVYGPTFLEPSLDNILYF